MTPLRGTASGRQVAVAAAVRPTPPAADDPLLRTLRTQTGYLHQSLDARLIPHRGAAMTLARYTAFLRATSAVVLPMETALALRLGGVFYHQRAGERQVALAHDLADLDTAIAAPEPSLPAIDTRADAFGAAYVILGSHLGGQMIGRGLFGRDTSGATPTRYVHLYGPDLGAMWKGFTAALAASGAEHDDAVRDHVASVAVAVFTAFGLALDREGVPR